MFVICVDFLSHMFVLQNIYMNLFLWNLWDLIEFLRVLQVQVLSFKNLEKYFLGLLAVDRTGRLTCTACMSPDRSTGLINQLRDNKSLMGRGRPTG